MGRSGFLERTLTYKALPSQWDFHRSTAPFKGFSGLLRDITQPALFELLSSNSIPYTFNKSENLVRLLDCDSRIILRSLHNYEALRGTNLAWFGVDELTFASEAAWQRLEARLRDTKATRLCGFATWTPRGFDWVYRKFISDPVKDFHVTLAEPFENRFVLDKVPDYYEHLRLSYGEEFFKQEVLGQYLNTKSALVYHAFNRHDHLADLEVDTYLDLYWSLDFNVNPMSSIVAQIKGDTVYVVDEIVLRHASTEMACAAFIQRYPRHPAQVYIYGDASGHAQSTGGQSDYEIVKEALRDAGYTAAGFLAAKFNPPVQQRVSLVNGKFRNCFGDISLQVDRRCKELIKDFEQVSYKGDSLEIDKHRDKYRTHVSDALGYLIWQKFRHVRSVGGQPNRIM